MEPKPAPAVPKRSNSVRAPATHSTSGVAGLYGGLHHTADQVVPAQPKVSSDNKRRTVQVEYVKPNSETKRASAVDADEAEDAAAPPPVVSTNKDPANVSRSATSAGTSGRSFAKFLDGKKSREDKMPGPEKGKTRPVSYQYQPTSARTQQPSQAAEPSQPASDSPSRRPSKEKSLPPIAGQSASKPQQDSPVLGTAAGESGTRPSTANSLVSSTSRLPSRGSGPVYSRPAGALVVANTAQGRMAMPRNDSQPQYSLSSSGDGASYDDRPQALPDVQAGAKGHKRANTVGGAEPGRFLGRIMGGSNANNGNQAQSDRPETADRIPGAQQSGVRPSMDMGGRKHSERSKDGPPVSGSSKPRRFSLIPAGFSLRSISGSTHQRKNSSSAAAYAQGKMDIANLPPPSSSSSRAPQARNPQAMSQPQLAVPRLDGRESAFSNSDSSLAPGGSAPASPYNHPRASGDHRHHHQQQHQAFPQPHQQQQQQQQYHGREPVTAGPTQTPDYGTPPRGTDYFGQAGAAAAAAPPQPAAPQRKPFLAAKHKKFGDAYEGETTAGGHGSSGPARRVMDFFRRRGVVRSKGA